MHIAAVYIVKPEFIAELCEELVTSQVVDKINLHHPERIEGAPESCCQPEISREARDDVLGKLQELDDVIKVVDNVVFSTVKKTDVCFAQDIWLEPQVVTFQSISEAVNILRQAGKFWYM